MTPWVEALTCELCGHTGSDVKPSWARWKVPHPTKPRFQAVDRCQDRLKCRERCEAQGDPWLVADTVRDLPRPAEPEPTQPEEVAAP